MFTGIITSSAGVMESQNLDGSLNLAIDLPKGWDLHPGDSVATNGVCLTVKSVTKDHFEVELMPETLKITTFGETIPKKVNLERPLRLNDLLDGHLVQGHVDATGRITSIETIGDSKILWIDYASRFNSYLVEKGSVTVDGISLTVVQTKESRFSVSLVSFTLEHTTITDKAIGDAVNLEFDIIAKYIAKMLPKSEHSDAQI